MDANRMKRELGGGAVFPIGAENTAYAQYFTGECYLNMLTTSGVGIGVVTFAPGTINAWHIHHKGGQILLVTGDAAGIRRTENRHGHWPPETLSIFPRRSSIGMAPPWTAGSSIWPWRSPQKAHPMSGGIPAYRRLCLIITHFSWKGAEAIWRKQGYILRGRSHHRRWTVSMTRSASG